MCNVHELCKGGRSSSFNPPRAERFFSSEFREKFTIVSYDSWSSNPLEHLQNLYYLLKYAHF